MIVSESELEWYAMIYRYVINHSKKTNNKNKQKTYLTLRKSFLYPGHLKVTATIIICSEKEKNVAQF